MTLSSYPLGLSLSPWDLMVCVQGGVHATLTATKLWGKSSKGLLGDMTAAPPAFSTARLRGPRDSRCPASPQCIQSLPPGIPSLCLRRAEELCSALKPHLAQFSLTSA